VKPATPSRRGSPRPSIETHPERAERGMHSELGCIAAVVRNMWQRG